MAETGFNVFDRTVQKSQAWLREIMDMEGTQDRHAAYLMLRSTLHSLRDRLPAEEAADFGAQLPMLLRGLYFEGWNPRQAPHKWNKAEFLEHVRLFFKTMPGQEPDIDPERVVRTVFSVIDRKVSGGEIKDVRQSLPRDLQNLWPQASA